MASRNIGCFHRLTKLMKANTEQLACSRRPDNTAQRSDGRGRVKLYTGKTKRGWGDENARASEGPSPFSILLSIFIFL